MPWKTKWDIRPDFYILCASLILLLPFGWWSSALTAAAFHELCHYLAVRLFGLRVVKMTLSAGGMAMETEPMERGQAAACALAGPIGGLLALCLYRIFPRLAICAFLQSAFNLLPLLPLDGGRAVQNLLFLCMPERIANGLFACIQAGSVGFLLFLAFFGVVRAQLKLLPLLFLGVLFREKALAKKGNKGYNSPTKEMRYGYDRKAEKNPARRAETGTVHRW